MDGVTVCKPCSLKAKAAQDNAESDLSVVEDPIDVPRR